MDPRRVVTSAVLVAALGASATTLAVVGRSRTVTRGSQLIEPGAALATATAIDFGRDVRPLLARSCLPCHGFDPSTREAGLRLDSFAGATAERPGGRPPVIVPGDAGASRMVERIACDDPRDRMPPVGEPLTPEEVDTIRAWIDAGAVYDVHWSRLPLEPVAPPPATDPEWSSPVDAFIRSRLDAAGLAPTARADRRSLLRRASFDLTGLPPTPAELDAFAADPAPGAEAFAAQIDRLLASPHFGERWARHWLDLVRYAETYGHEFDYPIHGASRYRDYVIRAFNLDLPYDRFVTEHLAGDLLDPPRRHPGDGTNESILGTAFWWLSQGTHAPTDVRTDEAERIDNQIDVLSKTFLATTVACARCHDHKFDPITQAEYHGLAGYVQSSRRQLAYLDPGQRIAAAAARLADLHAVLRTEAETTIRPALRAARTELPAMLGAVRDVLHGTPADGETADTTPDRLLASFDGDDYGDWTVTGDAFGDGPFAAGPGHIAGEGTATGRGFANSHRRAEDGDSQTADARTGRLRSPEFVLEHRYLHLRIGGGRRPGETGVRVLAGDAVIAELTGHDAITFRSERIDLDASRGRRVAIEIFDDVAGGWGNIRADELVLSDLPKLGRPPRRSIRAVAAERGLDPDRLAAWLAAFAGLDADHPMSAWTEAGDAVVARAPAPAPAQPFPDFTADWPATWFATGWAFDGAPRRLGDWHAPGEQAALVDTLGPDSGRLARSLQGTLRSPTFDIAGAHLQVRVRGTGRLRVIIDGYHLDEFNALLFKGCMRNIDGSEWHWIDHDLSAYVGHRAHYEIIDERADAAIAVDAMRWSDEALSVAGPEPLPRPTDARWRGTDRDEVRIANWLLASGLVTDPRDRSTFSRVTADVPSPVRAPAMADGTPEDDRISLRGDHRTPGPVVPRGFIADLMAATAPADGAALAEPTSGSGRDRLAALVLDPANPLPARVMVNRVWHHLFGRGIVATPDDFGLLGASPTHPALLDHLAERFRTEMGWSVKTLVREIITSRAYAMASGPLDSAATAIDPENRLWSTRTPRRLDGESLRDAVLTVSGRLDRTMHGPSVPVHLTAFMNGRGRPARSGPLDGDGRRSIYLTVRRNFPHPMMQAFDAPVPHSTMGARSRSNVPAQSLILMNDPFVHQQAAVLADRLRAEVGSGDDGASTSNAVLDRLYRLALGRLPSPDERRAMVEFLLAPAPAGGGDPLTDLCHITLNLKEFSFLD